MSTVLAGVAAALVAWPLNRAVVGRLGRPAIIFLVPLLEEGLKTGLGFALGASLLGVHLVFGGIEAVYDSSQAEERSLLLSTSSVLGHLLFGSLTLLVWRVTGYLLLGTGVAILTHMLWNALLTDLRQVRGR